MYVIDRTGMFNDYDYVHLFDDFRNTFCQK